MRYHVLGVGSIGSLIAFHVKRSIKLQRKELSKSSSMTVKDKRDLFSPAVPDPRHTGGKGTLVSSLSIPPYVRQQLPDPRLASVTLHLRKRMFAKQLHKPFNRSVIVEQEGVRDLETGFLSNSVSNPQDVVASVVRDARDEDAESDLDPDEVEADRFSISRKKPSGREQGASALTSTEAIPDLDGGISLISSLEGVHSAPRASPIDSLIVTTKCDVTLSAIESIRNRIHPWSTIVLLQNGMGVLDMLNERVFPDPEQRPNFILASTTHGCWRKGPLDTVHASSGSLHFSIVPSPRAGLQKFERHRVLNGQAIPPTPPIPSTVVPPRPRTGKGWDRFADLAASKPEPRLDPNAPSNLLAITSIPDQPSLQTLRCTVAGLLALPLDVHWEPIADFQLRMLRKLVINACINPLTALADCKNGELYGNPAAMDAMWTICAEAGMVIEAQVREYLQDQEEEQDREGNKAASPTKPRRRVSALPTADLLVRSSDDGTPILNPALTPNALFQEVQRVVRLTASNWSSMHSDIKIRRGSTEIDFINGYISALGRGYGIHTPANDVISSMIKLKATRLTGSNL